MAQDNFDTLWLQQNLTAMAIGRAQQMIAQTGRALPCKVLSVSGSLVEVGFQVAGPGPWQTLPPITIPRAESQWLRNPTQVGDVGVTQPADTLLGGISGQGSGLPDPTKNYGNLSSLVFVPITSTAFSASPDTNKAWVNGPNGAILSDQDQTVSVVTDHGTGQITITAGSFSVIVDKSTGTLQIGGSGTSAGNGIVNKTDLQDAINAVMAAVVAWVNANFQAGSNTAPAPANPTATASAVSFTV